MLIHHTETYEGFTLTVGQEWKNAGVYWRLQAPGGILPDFDYMCPGRFYMGPHGETFDDVVKVATAAAKRWLENPK